MLSTVTFATRVPLTLNELHLRAEPAAILTLALDAQTLGPAAANTTAKTTKTASDRRLARLPVATSILRFTAPTFRGVGLNIHEIQVMT
jgi:hypothetical protein